MDALLSFLATPRKPAFYTLLAVGFVGFFVLKGIKRGAFKELFNILSLAGAYFFSEPLGKLLEPYMPESIPGLLHGIAALTIAGIIAYIGLIIFFMVCRHVLDLDRNWKGKKKFFVGMGGALFGGAFGVFTVMLIVWYALTVGTLTQVASIAKVEEESSQGIMQVTNDIIGAHKEALEESVVSKVVQEANPIPNEITETIETMTTLVQDPQAMQKIIDAPEFQNIIQQDAIQNILEDEEIRSLAEQGNIMGLLNNESVQEVMNDPAVQEAMNAIDEETIKELLGK